MIQATYRPRLVSGSARAVIGTVKGGAVSDARVPVSGARGGAVSGAKVPVSGARGGGYARERRGF
jgi:hypothetical protein